MARNSAGSLYVYSRHISIGSTLPISPQEAAANKAICVVGSVEVQRDLDELVDAIDPLGEAEYRREMRGFGAHAEPTRECECWRHEGRRDLPERVFRSSADPWCIGCRMKAEALTQQKRTPRAKWHKAFRLQKRTS